MNYVYRKWLIRRVISINVHLNIPGIWFKKALYDIPLINLELYIMKYTYNLWTLSLCALICLMYNGPVWSSLNEYWLGFLHILCSVFVLFFFVLCTLCCQCSFWFPLQYYLTFICISSYHDSWNLLNSTINTNNLNEQKKPQLFILYIH